MGNIPFCLQKYKFLISSEILFGFSLYKKNSKIILSPSNSGQDAGKPVFKGFFMVGNEVSSFITLYIKSDEKIWKELEFSSAKEKQEL